MCLYTYLCSSQLFTSIRPGKRAGREEWPAFRQTFGQVWKSYARTGPTDTLVGQSVKFSVSSTAYTYYHTARRK